MKNVSASVLSRLKNYAKANGAVYNEVLVRFAIERVLKRLERTPHASKCILKGGTLFFVWGGGFSFRPTMDADLEFRGDGSPESLARIFRDVANVSCESEDGLRIDADSIRAIPIREDDQYGGVRVTMTARIGTVRIPVQIDIGVGDAITPMARKMMFPTILDMEAPFIKMYPRETVVAEKFQTIVKRGIANSRMKDYYDLWMLSADENVDRAKAKLAIARTFERRKTAVPSAVPVGLSEAFAIDPDKSVQWRAFVRKNRLDIGEKSLSDVVASIREFLMPLITVDR